MLEAIWSAAEALPEKKQDRVKPLFAPLALKLTDPKAKAVWELRLGDVAVENEDFATAERAYDKAVRLGDDSVFARPDDQVGLVSAVRALRVAGTQVPCTILESLG